MPQLTEKEQIKCRILVGKGHTPGEITEKLGDARAKRTPPVPPPDVTSVRHYLRGVTHRVGTKETRGRKRTFNVKKMRTLNKARKALLKKAIARLASKPRASRYQINESSNRMNRITHQISESSDQ